MIPIGNVYYLLCYAWDCFEEAGLVHVQELEDFERSENLFGTLLARGVIRLARRGLDQSYIPFEEELPGIRGKIEIDRTLKQNSLLRHRLVCSFSDLSTDVVHNQIIASTLNALLKSRCLD